MTDIVSLIHRYLKEELDDSEKQELEQWKEESETNRRIFEELTADGYLLQAVKDDYKIDSDEIALHKIHALVDEHTETNEAEKRESRIRSIWRHMAVAAAVLILVLVSAVFLLRKHQQSGTETARNKTTAPVDIAPGSVKATLKLADGRTVVLDSATIGQLARQGNTSVINKDGQLVYAGGGNEKEVLYNTVSTAKGQTYPLILSDNSRIWLNSESSIRFPVAFTGDLREVQVTGEVFFEVAHDARKPFRVAAKDMQLQVLGTTFNVNAYDNENSVKATLVEGSISVQKGIRKKTIRPGQQAEVLPDDIKVSEVDVDKSIAWKQGLFRFKEDKLSEALKNVARWYDVEVVFEGNAGDIDVSGTIPRSANLSEVVKLLALIGVEARIEGRKLVLKAK